MITIPSAEAIAISITGLGVLVCMPVASIATVSGAVSNSLTAINKKLEKEVNKHSIIHSLVVAKHDTINSSVSKALDDNSISDMK